MPPSEEQRLARIREVNQGALRYYLTAYLRTDEEEEHTVNQRDMLMAYATQAANVQALLDGDDLDDRSMMLERHEVGRRYLDEVRENPWESPT
jgi:hypothetical protein